MHTVEAHGEVVSIDESLDAVKIEETFHQIDVLSTVVHDGDDVLVGREFDGWENIIADGVGVDGGVAL